MNTSDVPARNVETLNDDEERLFRVVPVGTRLPRRDPPVLLH